MESVDINWITFLQPYKLAVDNFVLKLGTIKRQYTTYGLKNPIEDITGRVKTPNSILEKLKRMKMDISEIKELNDIAGIRITCKYIQDVYKIYDILKSRKDIKIKEIKDYIKNPKQSGYRSLHVIAYYNAETINGQERIIIEFQIRTLAMHLWACIEHSLKYKYYRSIPESLKVRLQNASKIANELDIEMEKLKKEMDDLPDDEERIEVDYKEWHNTI